VVGDDAALVVEPPPHAAATPMTAARTVTRSTGVDLERDTGIVTVGTTASLYEKRLNPNERMAKGF